MNGKLFCETCGRPFDVAPVEGAPSGPHHGGEDIDVDCNVFPGLGGPGVARGTDPGTSWAAAKSSPVTKESQRGRVLLCHYQHPDGMTDSALEQNMGLRLNSCSTRRSELKLKGYVEDSGKTATTEAGATAVVWRISAAGRAYVEAHLLEGTP